MGAPRPRLACVIERRRQRALDTVREARRRLIADLEAHAESGSVLQDELVALASERIAQSDHVRRRSTPRRHQTRPRPQASRPQGSRPPQC